MRPDGSSKAPRPPLAPLLLLLVALARPEVLGQQVASGAQLAGADQDGAQASLRAGPRPRAAERREAGRRWPAFAVEPPALLEYSNSTGAVLECRASAGPQAGVAVSWRRVRRLPHPEAPALDEEPLAPTGGLRVRQDGALVLPPFPGGEERAATYRCCLSSRMGALCSRPARTRAVIDSPVNVEVFDELVLAGGSVALRCHLPAQAARHLEVVGWLRDERPLSLGPQPPPRRPQAKQPDGQTEPKYLMLPSGHLYIRNASKADAAAYKCRVRQRLSGALFTSPLGGRLQVEEVSAASGSASPVPELRPLGAQAPLVHAREGSAALLCAQLNARPPAHFSWFRQDLRQPILPSAPDFRQLEGCLLIPQVQARHAGDYLCEASGGQLGPPLRLKTRLEVSSAQLGAQLQLVQAAPASPPTRAAHHTVQLGAQLYLNCSITGQPFDTVAWFKDGALLAVAPAGLAGSRQLGGALAHIRLVQATVIVLDSFGLRDRGVYQCQVYSAGLNESQPDGLRSASSALQLELALSKPAIGQRFAASQTLERAGPLALQCAASGLPLPRLAWYLDGMPISAPAAPGAPEWAEPLPELEGETDFVGGGDWTRNEIIDDGRFQIGFHLASSATGLPLIVSQLNVTQVSASESGQYKCLATSPLGSAQHVGQVNILSPQLEPRAYQPTNVTLVMGRTATLQCPLVGFPLAKVDWFHNERRVPANHRQHLEAVRAGVGGQLELVNVDKADAGLYTCRAALQPNGSAEPPELQDDSLVGQVRAEVRVAPLIDSQSLPELVQANEGMRTKLVCSVVEGDHPVEIRWLRRVSERGKVAQVGRSQLAGFELVQNSAQDDAEDSVTIHNLEDSCLLTFKQISFADSADYLCLAQNAVSRATRLTRVVVNVAPAWSAEPPGELSVLLGHRLQLDCAAHGHPAPAVTWRRDSQPLPAAEGESAPEYANVVSNYRQRAYLNGSLVIEQVEQVDAGSFMCELANGVGTGLSKVVRLRVNVPPHFKQRSSTQLGQLGGKAELRCLAHGDQPMVVGWRKDNEVVELVNDSRHRQVAEHRLGGQLFESVLSVDNLTRADSAQYTCVASNEFGTEEARLSLLVQEPPEPPALLRPVKATSRQATLSFRPPYSGNSYIRRYAVSFRPLELNGSASSWQQTLLEAPSGQSQPLEPDQAANQTGEAPSGEPSAAHLVSLSLCCLQPHTRYQVRVRAVNEVGQSEPSKPVPFVTDEEAIGGPPQDVGVEPTGAHSLKVRWRAPARHLQNGLIRGYYIGYRAISGPSPPGAGALPALARAQGAPDGLQRMVQSSSNVKVFEAMDGEQYQYKNVQLEPVPVGFRQFGLDGPQQVELNGSALSSPQVATSYLTNLRRKTTYSIIVQAYSKIGAGPRSDQVLVSTLDAAPPMSPVLRLVSVSYNAAQLAWSSRRFNQQLEANASGKAHRSLAFEESPELEEEEEEEDPQSFYTINFKNDDRGLSTGANLGQDAQTVDWQQRRLTRRQQVPYTLNNLRCGTQYSAFMTATNSLGQSEPGEIMRFATQGAAPLAPSSSRDFLQVNASQVSLRLGAWQNEGCTIASFLIKYRAASQLKWTIVEHQVHPTIQTVTLSGSAAFTSRPLEGAPGQEPDWAAKRDGFEPANRRQLLSDFVIRNLALNTAYRLVVEASSEAGSTLAEYELETANLTSSTLSIHVNGISADSLATGRATGNGRASLEATDSGELDFSYSGGQRLLDPLSRYSLGVWSLTVLFVIASVCMAATTLVLGFRSLVRMSALPKGSRRNQILSALLCCSNSSSAASSAAGSSHSSSGGTCYQLPVEHSMLDAYCHGLMLNNGGNPDATPTRAQVDGGELKAIKGDSLPFRQLAASSSLSTICRMNAGQQQAARHTNTLAGATLCHGRRFSEESEAGGHLRTHYAATLGKKHSSFVSDNQPLKFHPSPLYGHLQTNHLAADSTQQQYLSQSGAASAYNYQHQVQPISSAGTSGYETSNSQNNAANSLYLRSVLADDAYQMNVCPPPGLAETNLFADARQNQNQNQQQQQQNQYHYNLPREDLNLEAVYGALLANQQVAPPIQMDAQELEQHFRLLANQQSNRD